MQYTDEKVAESSEVSVDAAGSVEKRVDDTVIMQTSSSSFQSQVPTKRQSGERSSYAIDSVDRVSGDTETDAEHREDPEDC